MIETVLNYVALKQIFNKKILHIILTMIIFTKKPLQLMGVIKNILFLIYKRRLSLNFKKVQEIF